MGQIKAEQIADLRGFAQALKDGELNANELFKNKVEENPQAIKVETPKPQEGKLL